MIFIQMLSDGFSILNLHKAALLVFFMTTFGLGLFAAHRLNLEKFLSGVGLLACFGLGSLLLVAASYLLAVLAIFLHFALPLGGFLVVLFAAFVMGRQVLTHKITLHFDGYLIATLIVLFLLLLVRLSFLKHILVPSYSDSPLHYQEALELLGRAEPNPQRSMVNISSNYYHYGFHSLVAWLVSVTGIAPLDAMSFLPQIFLVIGPVSVFGLAFALTDNIPSALLAGLLAAIGWPMPAFAVNWGKFPALLALAVAPSALTVLLYQRNYRGKWKSYLLVLLLLISPVLLHTRVIFVLALAAASFYLTGKLSWDKQAYLFPTILRSLVMALFFWSFLTFFGDAYKIWTLWALLFALTPFGLWVHPRLLVATFACLAGIWLMMLLALPIFGAPGGLTLLDRPFLEILLVIPFSLWGAVGFSGLLQKIGTKQLVKIGVSLAAFSLVFYVFFVRGAYLPDPCCNFFKAEDALAFQWIRENKASDTLFVTSTFSDGRWLYSADAGSWIQPLTGVATQTLPYDTNWKASKTFENLCSYGARQTYLYTSGIVFSFPAGDLATQSWLQPVFRAGPTHIYQVTGCPTP
jgi:hypothetical protein